MDAHALTVASLTALTALGADALLAPRIRNRRWRERLTNVSCGVARYAVHGLAHGAFLGLYAAILAVSPLALPVGSSTTWVLGFLAFDFLIFVTHYLAHRVPLLWAIHSVHHQPEEIDVSVGLRTHVLTSLFYLPLLLPLAALGVPLAVFLTLGTLRLAAMALTHTRLRTPRWLDAFVNTPELHAIHHSADPRHFDKNLGGILMLWDRLLGSDLPREPVARCGLPGPAARGAVEANLQPLRALAREVRGRYPSSRWLARSAPARSARSFSQTTSSATSPRPAAVPKPQSVPASTRCGSPTARAASSRRSATTSGCST